MLALLKCKLKIVEVGHLDAELDRLVVEDARVTLQHQFDHSTMRNEELTRELESTH